MTYISDIEPQGAALPADELSEFVISRLAELAVVLFNDHIGYDAAALKDRSEGQVVLLALGDLAAEHGRPEWSPILHNLAAKIETVDPS